MSKLHLGGTSGRFVPVGGHVTSRVDGQLHAVDWSDALDRTSGTVCGLPASVLVAQEAVMERPGAAAEVVGVALVPWPPYQAQGRCAACWEQTGRPRVAAQWRDIDADALIEDVS